MVVPADPEEYGIYYAYTELWFDQPRDLWIAVGSDDQSTLWIDDQCVWISSDELKGWRIDEGLRKVHFKQGLNRIVYRPKGGDINTSFLLLDGVYTVSFDTTTTVSDTDPERIEVDVQFVPETILAATGK